MPASTDSVVIVGNCQATALEMVLSTNDAFTERFTLVPFPAVHEISPEMMPTLHQAVADAKVVIPQRIEESYRDGIGLGTETLARLAGNATVVRWPSTYWAGYFPDLFYLRDTDRRPVVDGPFDYHDRLVLEAFHSGATALDACRMLEDPDRPSAAEEWVAAATAELDVREAQCDVTVAPFIASHFQEQLLFFTMNHPTNLLLGRLAHQIAQLIGVPGVVDHRKLPDELLGPTFYPLHANHVRALGLRFGAQFAAGATPFRIRGAIYEPIEAIQAFYDYYAANPRLVSLNLTPDAAQL